MTSFFAAVSRFLRRLFRRTSRPGAPAPQGRQHQERLPRQQDRRLNQQATSGSKADGDRQPVAAELRQLVYRATCNMPRPRMHAGQFGSRLRQLDPAFTYQKYQFVKLIDLLAAVPDIVNLERVDNPEAAPAYYVRSRLDTRALLVEAMNSFNRDADGKDGWEKDGWVHIESAIAAMTSANHTFAIETYGFQSPRSFIEIISQRYVDLIELKPDDPRYIRLHRGATPQPQPRRKRPVSPKRTYARPTVKTASQRQPKPSPNHSTHKIVHLSKFAGFTPQILNQKVSELAAIALPERWYFGPQPPANFAYPILKSYLRYTFIRLQHERKVITSTNQKYRAFNTGLLDKLLRPIYALMLPYPAVDAASSPAWNLIFCISGEGSSGKALVSNFTQLPTTANYLSDPSKVFYHLAAGTPEVDWPHIIKDNMERLPPAFLAQYAPTGFTYRNTQTLNSSEFHTYKKSFATALDQDPRAYRSIVNRLKEALSRTLLKTQINYKTAVPTYYPTIDSIDLLLPICLVEEDIADCALVVRMANSGKYIGHTILTLRQAYNNARLICKLDEHWLTRSMALSQANFEADDEEEDDSEEFEALEELAAENDF